MFARIVPAVRTPSGMDAFDYLIPEGMSIEIGQLVLAPFRRTATPGIVTQIIDESPFASKAKSLLSTYGSIIFPPSTLNLLAWTSKRTFCSQPTILKAWLRELPKRPPKTETPIDLRLRQTTTQIETYWEATYETHLMERAIEWQKKGKRVLIITPWVTRLRRYADTLKALSLEGDQATGTSFQAWYQFLEQPSGCLVATRIGAWLGSCADIILLDEPENDDHKQDELQPRYDARRLISWCALHGGTIVESFGRTPPLHVDKPAPTINASLVLHPRHPQGRSAIPCVQADSLLALAEHDGPRCIIHPIRGMMARLHCRDCDWQAACTNCSFPLSAEFNRARCRRCLTTTNLPLECPNCGGTELNKSIPGMERLKQAWQNHLPDISIEWRDLTNEQLDPPFAQHTLVVVTQPAFLGSGSEDLRRRERQCIAFRRLAARLTETGGRLILQCEESDIPQWSSWLTQEGLQAFFQEERSTRHLFRYPPSARRIKIILEGDEAHAFAWQAKNKTHLPARAVWEGPFQVSYRRNGQSARTIWHLILPPEIPEQSLIQALEPFANEAIIDLDPIAFFA